MLLLPYRTRIEWVPVEDLAPGDIYYGSRPELANQNVCSIGLHTDTVDFFSSTLAVPASFDTVTIGGEDVPALFGCSAGGPFDFVASAFYFLSGWQEVHTTARDEHGRVRFTDSVQATNNLAYVPVVDVYRRLFEHRLRGVGTQIERKQFSGREWAFCPTHDIDYDKKWRPGIIRRELLHRAVLNHEREGVKKRLWRVSTTFTSLFSGSDPFRDALRRIRIEILKRDGTGTFFFKTAARDPHDVRFSADSSFLRSQYQELKLADFEIGLHPSYHAFNHTGFLQEERNLLASSSGVQATIIRSHYLRFDPLRCPGLLESCGFEVDSTLGWATQEGFRRGTCLPYTLFDLSTNTETSVVEMPLIAMESTLFNRRNYSLEAAITASERLIEICQKHGGVYVGLWHNTLWDEDEFPGWGDHFTSCLSIADRKGGLISSLGAALESWK